jgi:ADP-ribosyl-[dinitrogen reductase] hydrolase
VVHTLEAALWAVDTTDSFAAALLKAVNLGDDADSVGAVAGQLAGARYGLSAIPTNWLDALILRETIEKIGQTLFNASLEWKSDLSIALGDDALAQPKAENE